MPPAAMIRPMMSCQMEAAPGADLKCLDDLHDADDEHCRGDEHRNQQGRDERRGDRKYAAYDEHNSKGQEPAQ